MRQALQISASGLVTSVGLGAAETAAAVRAGVSNPQLTRFVDWGGEPIAAHVVPLEAPDARTKLLRMAAAAIDECLGAASPAVAAQDTVLLLCQPEPDRPGAAGGPAALGIQEVEAELGIRFSAHSSHIPAGRVGGMIGLHRARLLLQEGKAHAAIVAGADSYVSWPVISGFENRFRLLTSRNSDGFLPGEAAAAVLVTRPTPGAALRCEGLGFAQESATVEAELPLRADGLVQAVRAAAREAGCRPDAFGLRISALSGEHYFFKEAALAASRLVREPRDEAELWHPADCVGEVGAAAAPLAWAIAHAACAKGYAGASRILCHVSGDGTERAAAFFSYEVQQ